MFEFGYSGTGDNTYPCDFEDHRRPSGPDRGAYGEEQSFPADHIGGASSFRCCRYVSFAFLYAIINDSIVISRLSMIGYILELYFLLMMELYAICIPRIQE